VKKKKRKKRLAIVELTPSGEGVRRTSPSPSSSSSPNYHPETAHPAEIATSKRSKLPSPLLIPYPPHPPCPPRCRVVRALGVVVLAPRGNREIRAITTHTPIRASAGSALFRASSGLRAREWGGEAAEEIDVGGGGGGGARGTCCEDNAFLWMRMLALGASPAEAAPDMERLRG
jgi:hypothetical protein